MKTLVLLAIVLFAACASPTAVIDQRAMQCGPGQDVGVEAGLDDGSTTGETMGEVSYLVQVTNNSHGEVTVKSIRVDPSDRENAGYESASKAFNQTIAENDEQLFRLPVTAAWNHGAFDRQRAQRKLTFYVTVLLANGDSYHCPFEVSSSR